MLQVCVGTSEPSTGVDAHVVLPSDNSGEVQDPSLDLVVGKHRDLRGSSLEIQAAFSIDVLACVQAHDVIRD